MIVIGVGNPWRGDDGAGPAVTRRLRGAVEAVEHDGDGSRLVDAWRGRDHVVVVDAAASGARPGTVRRFRPRASPLPAALLRSSTHAFGVAEAVELARALGQLPPRLDVYAIEGADFSAGAGLSPAVAEAVDRLAVALADGAGGR
jgi:hydrogenase maturation protease